MLGTASQVPTRERHHNGYLLRWDDEMILFDPGEGTQRQMTLAGVAASGITRICITHFHGDHCLGLPGVIQRLSLDGAAQEIPVHYPASGDGYFERLRHASVFHDRVRLRRYPLEEDHGFGEWEVKRLAHPIEAFGYRLKEPDGRRMLPELLAARGIAGPDIGRLRREGSLRGVTLEQVSEVRPGQVFAFVMDTGVCDAAVELAAGADLLVIESTFLDRDAELAARYGHLTAAQSARIAAEAGVRKLVLTHFSQRYADVSVYGDEAARYFSGQIVVARELDRIPVPPRS